MTLPQSLLAAVIVLVFIFVLVGGCQHPEISFAGQAANHIARTAISGAAVVALVALIISKTARR